MDKRAVFQGAAAETIGNGAFSRVDRAHVGNRRGTDHTCQLCDRPIAPHAVEGDARRDAAMLFHLHVASRAAWGSGRQRD
jgi:hypothetical protein